MPPYLAFYLSWSTPIVNHSALSPNSNCLPTLLVIPCNFFLEDYRFTLSQTLLLTNWCFIQISIIHDNISSQVVDKRRYGFGQWTHSSIIHDNTHSLTRSDIKYHTTLNIIFRCSSSWEGENFSFIHPTTKPCNYAHSTCYYSLVDLTPGITLFRSKATLCGTDNILQNISHIPTECDEHYVEYCQSHQTLIIIFANLGLFRHFETIIHIRTWIKSHIFWRML